MLDNTKGSKPKSTRIKFENSDTVTLVVENEFCKIYNDTRSGKTFKVIDGEMVPLELRELNMWKNRQKNPGNFAVDTVKDENGKIDYVISRNAPGGAKPAPAPAAPAPSNAPTAPVHPSAASRPTPPAPPSAAARSTPPSAASRPSLPTPPAAARTAPAAPKSNGGTTTTISSSPKPSRIKFELTPTTELVLENEFFKLYKDTRSGKTFKVINGEVAPIELRELNMWKNRQKTPGNFSVEIVQGTDGTAYDYNISRASSDSASQNAPTEEKTITPPNVQLPADDAIKAEPAAVRAKVDAAVSTAKASAAPAPAPNKINPDMPSASEKAKKSIPSVTNTVGTAPTDRVVFEENANTEVVVENEFCKIYKNTRSGKTFKVINGMIAPIELRELNMWKNRKKNPSSFTVEIMKDEAGTPFDYIISRINEDGTLTKAPAVAPYAPYIPPENEYVPTTLSSELSAKKSEPVKPAQVFPVGKPSGAAPAKEAAEKVDVTVDRITFEETPSMSLVVDNEFFKIYNDSRRGKTFKVIEGKIAPIELRELNMWKNRQRKPKNFAVEIVRTQSGEIYDYKISRTEKSTTAAVESTSTKTNMPSVTDVSSNASAKKRRSNASRMLKCAICGNEFEESKLMLFDNRNFCSDCVENLIKAKLDFKPVDPIQKIIDDVVSSDELYCTYSTVTNYPYLDDEFCVNVCTVKKAAESMEEDTAVQTIDDKGIFFDDLKRFGLKKIIVNGDSTNIFEPQDFDKHVKTEGIIAPKLYFKILNFMQRKDDELRERIAASFIESKVYTYALNDEITEITEENIEDFKPLVITDGRAKFCPVFTDFTEAKSVGMPFRGLYEIDADLLSKLDITHYIINPSSLGFIMNKSILSPFVDDEPAPVQKVADEVITDQPLEDISESGFDDTITDYDTHVEPVAPLEPIAPIEPVTPVEPIAPAEEEFKPVASPFEDDLFASAKDQFADIFNPVAPVENVPEPQVPFVPAASLQKPETPPVSAPAASYEFSAPTPPPVAEQLFSQPTPPTPPTPAPQVSPVASQFYSQPTPAASASPVANQFYAQPTPPVPAPAPSPVQPPVESPAQKRTVDASEIVIKSNNTDGSKKALKVSMPVFIPDDPDADVDTSMNEPSALQKAINKSKAMFDDNTSSFGSSGSFAPKSINEPSNMDTSASSDSGSGAFNFSDIMSDFSSNADSSNGFELSSLFGQAAEEPSQPAKPKLTIQLQATEAKVIARDLEIEPDVRVAQILRDQLNESYRKLAKMISEADVMYAEFDSNTQHILIDGNNKGHIFSEKMYADKSVENFAKNGIDVFIKEYKNDELFNMLYEFKRHGIQDLVLDETANWVIISTDTIADMLDVNERKFVPIPVNNPELMFSMTTLFQKLKSKNDNPKRKQEIQSIEKMVKRELISARYILPMVVYNGTEVKPIMIEDKKNNLKKVLVFSDAFEMKRFFRDRINIVKDYEIITYKEIVKRYTVMSNTLVVLNDHDPVYFVFNEHNCAEINRVMNQ